MSNPSSVIDFSIPIQTWGSQAIGDGTWMDVFGTLKVDQAGLEADATTIKSAAGQIWGNAVDDFFILVYQLHAGAKLEETGTNDATPTTVKTLASLTNDGESWKIALEVSASDGSSLFLDGELGGFFYRTGGVVNVINAVDTIAVIGFVTADAALVINGNDIDLVVTGDAGTDVNWKIKVTRSEATP